MASGNKIEIAFLSVSTENSTDQFIEQIKRENYDLKCLFVKLTQKDLQSLQLEKTYDAVVLMHSISQGRNSITDVADAKYSKLLPKLKNIYGPDRVAVVVHSMTSFNSNTEKALMMVFKKSQPATFQCSNCVIQCNNLAEMQAPDLLRFTKFLGKVPDHPLPIAEDKARSTLTTTPSADKKDRIGTGDNSQSTPVSGAKSVVKGGQRMASSPLSSTDTSSMPQTEVKRPKGYTAIPIENGSPDDPLRGGQSSYVAPTEPSTNQTPTTNTSTSVDNSNLQNTAPGASQLDEFPINRQNKVLDTTYPIALFSLSSSNETDNVWDGLRRLLPGKTILLIKDIQELASNWHLFEAILVDLGSLQEAASYSSDEFNKGALDIYQRCLKGMLVPQNLAVLILAPAYTHSAHKHASDIIRMISEISKATQVSVFQYGSESCRQPLFDDNTRSQLVGWLRGCYGRYHAAALQEGPGFFKSISLQLAKLVPSFILKKLSR